MADIGDFTPAATYKDWVNLQKSGAGLPSHAGAEAALYDGAGNQVVGRTAQRHWLDPHPDAASFAETWEFSTYGDANQSALESDGWTFASCSGEVSNGILWITRTASAYWSANFATNFTGDFDVVVGVVQRGDYTADPSTDYTIGGFGVADTVNNVTHYNLASILNAYGRTSTYINGSWTTFGGTVQNSNFYGPPRMLRINRVSGTVRLYACSFEYPLIKSDDTVGERGGWSNPHAVADADTFDKMFFRVDSGTGAGQFGIRFIRRFQ